MEPGTPPPTERRRPGDRGGPAQRGRPVPRPVPVSRATYWRRRVSVLGVGAGLLTAASWAVNGMLTARSTAGQAIPPGGTGTAATSPAHGNAAAPRASLGRAHPSPSPSPDPVSSPHRSGSRPPLPRSGPACAPGDVTLSVSSPQYWYQPGKMPRFTVRAVSSERQACEFNMGTKFVSAVITSGDRRMWSSADCATGAGGSNVVVLANGTPGVLRVTWDRRTSSPGCTGSALVRPGEYQVSATAASLHSAKVNLVLGAKGASGP